MKKPGFFARLRRIAAWFCIIGGGSGVGMALVFAILTATFIHNAVETNGKIVDFVPVADEENHSTNYAPVFSFTASDGRTYTVTSNTSSNPPGFDPGQDVRVLYSPRNPSHARLKSTIQLWLISLISAPVGAFYAGLGFVLLYFDRRYRRKRVALETQRPASFSLPQA
jgi:hypothetical protein